MACAPVEFEPALDDDPGRRAWRDEAYAEIDAQFWGCFPIAPCD